MPVEKWIWEQVEAIIGTNARLSMALTGGGSELASWLLNHPGASSLVAEVQIPYHPKALEAYLDAPGPHRVELETGRAMAAQAFARTSALVKGDSPVIGLGCTAALATKRVRRGEDRACLAMRTSEEYHFYNLNFEKGALERLAQEDALSRFALNALAQACHSPGFEPREWPPGMEISTQNIAVVAPLEQLLRGEVQIAEMDLQGRWSTAAKRQGRVLFPGSFNPLHQGHIELAAAAQRLADSPLHLEISVENVDKPALAYREILGRLEQVKGLFPVVLSRAATFAQKVQFLPGSLFVIGCDTAVRIFDSKYYPAGEAGREKALGQLVSAGVRFLVAGRFFDGAYKTLKDVQIPEKYSSLFDELPQSVFRRDISSTEVRKIASAGK